MDVCNYITFKQLSSLGREEVGLDPFRLKIAKVFNKIYHCISIWMPENSCFSLVGRKTISDNINLLA